MQTAIKESIARQQPGWSLEQAFYTSDQIYQFELNGWLADQWYVLAHCSEVRESGSFIVRELLGESLLIARDLTGVLRGFYNVCRHRGSRICEQDGRSAGGFICPYHAWSYRLDGSLRAAASLPETVHFDQLGLRHVRVMEMGGLILVSLTGNQRLLDPVRQELEPGLIYHGIRDARIAERRSYPTRGNWKLVIENFVECYHCFPCHPQYCAIMKHVDVVARVSAEGAAAWNQSVDTWFREFADPSSPVPRRHELSSLPYGAGRSLIGGDYKTQSQDGQPVAPLMGQLQRFDGGVSSFRLEPFVYLLAANDHAMMFQFLPTGRETTDVHIIWLVNSTARDSDVDIERMTWLWDVTTKQDKALIERNAAGVRSRAYLPGPYSILEAGTARFVSQYLKGLSARC